VTVERRKLIEVSLPLKAISEEAARDKSLRHGHPSTLHMWWARRPLAAARAVVFAQLVDDPSAQPDRYPTEEDQNRRRAELHALIEDLVLWENADNADVLAKAHKEILDSTGGRPPTILDPFAGGGTIPLEAQRLGLTTIGSDLNPVAVLINKALVEIPPKFRDRRPVYPGLAESQIRSWKGPQGLAADIRAYGQWIYDEARKRIGHLYPQATMPDGSTAPVIAWLWARTVVCPNPRCGLQIPLARSWWLGKKPGKEAYLVPRIVNGRVEFDIGHDLKNAPTTDNDGSASGTTGAVCIGCRTALTPAEVHDQLDRPVKPEPALLAVVALGHRRREYLPPNDVHATAARDCSAAAEGIREGDPFLRAQARGTFGGNAQGRRYGFYSFVDYFTDRQLVVLTTFSDLISEARDRVVADSVEAGRAEGTSLSAGGADANAYGDAVATYLAFALSRMTEKNSSIASWSSDPKMEAIRGVFARQAISMTWDFAEANPWGKSGGDYNEDIGWVSRVVERLPATPPGSARQADARSAASELAVIATDPPYYDNIGYSDLSDFFYVWLRRTLGRVWPDLFTTMLCPKAEELVMDKYRQKGEDKAKKFFEDGFTTVFARARESATTEYPITLFYAFKQAESTSEGSASSGWETLLEGIVRSGWMITGTWPIRSERSGRTISIRTNALGSSVVLALRPRIEGAPVTDRRGFNSALHDELPARLRELQHGAIAPVDLPQAAIGPGMAVFTRYSKVIEADGSAMSVRTALARINTVRDQVLWEMVGDFDAATRFAITWYRQHGYNAGGSGDANNVANAHNTSIRAMERAGILTSVAGDVTLIEPSRLPAGYNPVADMDISAWEVLSHLIRVLGSEGVGDAGAFLAQVDSRADGGTDPALVKELAFLLFSVADTKKWTRDAIAFNNIATSWSDLIDASRSGSEPSPTDPTLDFATDDVES
jgi:putative DNA methylase